ncbi:hypothetical protein RND81_05G079200 [Saponaria officinalis]|uniref:BHLH domain-containing protein n=1 Tax=Saponaria officinalis TaxID=3572 RepID=A0AAW1KTH7_SAPOF
MFPFQKGDLNFQVPNNNNNNNNEQNNYVINDIVNDAIDVIQCNYHLANNNTSTSITSQNTIKYCSKKSLTNKEENNISNADEGKNNGGNEVANKRVIHRENERQRRQEMAKLYSSLRSILPLEYIKGKRAMCDHISEATKYIKDLEKNVKDLGNKRDKLKETYCSSSSTKQHEHDKFSSTNACSSSRNGGNVSIHAFSKAIEIEICTEVEEEENPFPLSRVLLVLNEEGLDVVSCVSSKLNKMLVYVIHCQVENVASIDSCQLKWRLSSVIN